MFKNEPEFYFQITGIKTVCLMIFQVYSRRKSTKKCLRDLRHAQQEKHPDLIEQQREMGLSLSDCGERKCEVLWWTEALLRVG